MKDLNGFVKVMLFDKHVFTNDFKGQVKLAVIDYADNKPHDNVWFSLKPRKSASESITGEILLDIHFQVDIKELVHEREIDKRFLQTINQLEDLETQQKLIKLPTAKKWEYLQTNSIRLKTIGEEETEEHDKWEYYVQEMKSKQDIPIELLEKLKTKFDNTDSLGLRQFGKLEGFVWLFESLNYYLEHKLA